MQDVSDLYLELQADTKHWVEIRLAIGENGRLITKKAERITFGGVGILIGSSGADSGFDENILQSMSTNISLFSENTPSVGCCVAGEIDVKLRKPTADIPRKARLVPYVRLTNGTQYSEWLQKGVYYVDTREYSDNSDDLKWVTLHGYDAMLFAEADYPPSKIDYPAKDIDIVREIANAMDVQIDPRTVAIMTKGYTYSYPAGYSMREILSYIGASYAGCFIMSDIGELRLVRLGGLPKETRYLVVANTDRRAITFGGDRILV